MGLRPEVLRALTEMGFEQPTSIQAKAIPSILASSRDLIGRAQTGTGKTGAFGIPIVNHLDPHAGHVQALILCPTRELCLQITRELQHMAQFVPEIKVIPVYGGSSMDTQVFALKQKGQIVVGTPGRTLDLINRKKLKLDQLRWLVLDEADEMLSMGFKDDMDAILATTPKEKQTLLFSATLPREIKHMVDTYMQDPEEIKAEKVQTGADNVTHHFYEAQAKDRYVALKRILDYYPSIYAIVFCRTRAETKELAERLSTEGYNADALHGDLSQEQREYTMARFRNRSLQLLIATDVAARGLDVQDLTHVINYNLPDDPDVYIHRSGRTGRAHRKGVSVSIIHSREFYRLRDLEKRVGKPFEKKRIPTGPEICEKQLFHLVDKVENVEVDEVQIKQYLPAIFSKLAWLDRDELIKRFMSIEFNRFLNYYRDARDINLGSAKPWEARSTEKGERRTERGERITDKGERKTERGEWQKAKGEGLKAKGDWEKPRESSAGKKKGIDNPAWMGDVESARKQTEKPEEWTLEQRIEQRLTRPEADESAKAKAKTEDKPKKSRRKEIEDPWTDESQVRWSDEDAQRPRPAKRGEDRPKVSFARMAINLGTANHFTPKALLALVNQYLPDQATQIGKIDVQYLHTLFDVDADYKDQVVTAFKKAKYKGQKVDVDEVKSKKKK